MFWKKKKNKKEISLANEITITNYLADGLLVFDQENKLVLVNPQAEKFFEIKEEKILGKSILELNRFPNFEPLVSFLGGGIKEYFQEELKIRENFILEVTVVPIKTEGRKLGKLIVLHDITQVKLVDRMKSEFVTLAAHQLRTPSSAVKWSLRMLLEQEQGKLNKKQKEIIEKAYKSNDKMIRLINDLLNVAQIEEGKYLSKKTLSNIEEIIKSIINEQKKEIVEKQLKLRFEKQEQEITKVMIDAKKMKIAIANILDNAVRYTLAGGKVFISLKSDKKEITVQIKDTGLGIPLDEQDKVFTKFFRADNIMRIETEGTGLGLYIAKNIIEAHGGKIWFESKENKGTIFYFTIPIKEKFGEFLTEEFY